MKYKRRLQASAVAGVTFLAQFHQRSKTTKLTPLKLIADVVVMRREVSAHRWRGLEHALQGICAAWAGSENNSLGGWRSLKAAPSSKGEVISASQPDKSIKKVELSPFLLWVKDL